MGVAMVKGVEVVRLLVLAHVRDLSHLLLAFKFD